MPSGDRCMAEIPEGAVVFENRIGAAPGLAVPIDRCWIIALPGPPGELEQMVDRDVTPFLKRLRPAPATLLSRTLKVTGLVESHVHQRIRRWMTSTPPVTVGIYAHATEVDVVITAKERQASEPLAVKIGDPATFEALALRDGSGDAGSGGRQATRPATDDHRHR